MELKDILEAIGYTGEPKSPEDIVTYLNTNFVPRKDAPNDPELVKAITGKFFGEQKTALAKLSGGRFSREKLDELGSWDKGFEAVIGAFNTELEATKAKAKEGQAKQLLELQAQFEDAQKSIADYDRDKKALQSKLDEVSSSAANEIRAFKMKAMKKDYYAKVPWKDGMTDVERLGLETYLSSNYVIDLDEKDTFVIKDKEGHTIPNKKKAGSTLTFEDVVMEAAEANNLLKKNNVEPGRQRQSQRVEGEQPKSQMRKPLPVIGAARGY